VLAIPRNVFSLPSVEVWWPDDPGSVIALLGRCPLVTVHGCADDVAASLEEYSFRRKSTFTLLFDLSLPTVELWKGLKRKSCRQDINRALKLRPDIVVNEYADDAFRLINDHIRRKGYRGALRRSEWDGILSHGDVFSIRCDGVLIAAHAVLVDRPARARATIGGELDPTDSRALGMTGPMNRLLHWHEMNYYKDRGVRRYDFGGVVVDEASPMYNITKFKLSFGGETVAENVLQLWHGDRARAVIRQLAAWGVTRQIFHSAVQVGGRFRSAGGIHDRMVAGSTEGGNGLAPGLTHPDPRVDRGSSP